ncbi:uncharacterized protein LOC6595186 isoform X2 [Drosophila persimilis]|uniref:uncharacterized protein LOC6595186 isoform X2 n=1 Tax=Drosophila persimilis TaxID=7234 RepID=UPI000F090F75|nr:uncharacterized protein LOC6595186 isoform X2 [Drosophila persimilis]
MGRNLNIQIDLKELLAKSMADGPSGSHHGQWRVPCGKVRYAVHYTMKNGLLTILNIRRRRCTPSRLSRIAKRLRRLMQAKKTPQVTFKNRGTQTLKSRKFQKTKSSQTLDPAMIQKTKGSQTIDPVMIRETKGSQTIDPTMIQKTNGSQTDPTTIQETKGSQTPCSSMNQGTKASQAPESQTILETTGSQTSDTIMIQDNKASQFPESPRIQMAKASQTSQLATSQVPKCSQTRQLEQRTVEVDTIDLILMYSSYQQTLNIEQKSIGSQGQAPNCNTISTQWIPNTGDNGNQTSPDICCVGIQTVRGNNCVAVQTTTNNRSLHTQTTTTYVEAEVQKPLLDALNVIHQDFQNLTGLIENEMMHTVNQLVELSLMEVKELRLEADRHKEGLIEPPTTPTPSCEQIGDTLPVAELLCEQIGDTLPVVEAPSEKADKAKAKCQLRRTASESARKRRFGLTYTKRLVKAPHCSLPRLWMPIDCQEYSTQTDDLDELEMKVLFTGTDAFTQTEKKRRGWMKLV